MFLDIPFLQAFSYACSQPAFLICAFAATIILVFVGAKVMPKLGEAGKILTIVLFVLGMAIAWVIIPATIAAATSPEQAARGVFIWGS